jgi:methylated-DNA-[protein]-cysteine S-methyltransferase
LAADLMARPEPLRWIATPTPIGDLLAVASDRGVVETAFCDDSDAVPAMVASIEDRWERPLRRASRELSALRREVDGYFAGRVRAFTTAADVAWLPAGFARRVLETTATIPYGELWTYGDVAEQAGSPRAGRAAGNALSHCPIELLVPCHRVVHAGGSIGGYGRHEARKRWLIAHESPAAGEPDRPQVRTRG